MLDNLYRKRLIKDLPVWRDKGWVSADGAEHILAGLSGGEDQARFPIVLGFLGAVLIAAAAMTFVAANWEEIPRLARLGLLLAGMGIAYGFAVALQRRGYDLLADAAVTAGAAAFGAAIMLVGQIYHIQKDFPAGVALWSLGALIAAVLANSRGALAIAFAGFAFWSFLGAEDPGWIVHWPSLLAIAASTWLAVAWNWPAGRHLAVLALLFWLVATVFTLAGRYDWPGHAAYTTLLVSAGLLWAVAHWNLRETPLRAWSAYLDTLAPYALAGLLALLLILQFAGDVFPEPVTADEAGPFLNPYILALGLLAASALALVPTIRSGAFTRLDATVLLSALAIPLAVAFLADSGQFLALSTDPGRSVILAATLIGIAVWLTAYGHRRSSRITVNLALIAFGAEVLYIYLETFGSLLDTALFFLLGGVLLIALAWFLNRMRGRLTRATNGNEEVAP